jgi:large subunit ribosomal protein L15
MNLSDIKAVYVPRKRRKRVGRGGAHGKTSCRGSKGQKARSGSSIKLQTEGGQMPLFRRIPKRGFTNNFRKQYATLNVRDLEQFSDGEEITLAVLSAKGMVKKGSSLLKVLGEGEITRKVKVVADKFSGTARSKIEAAGGSVEVRA